MNSFASSLSVIGGCVLATLAAASCSSNGDDNASTSASSGAGGSATAAAGKASSDGGKASSDGGKNSSGSSNGGAALGGTAGRSASGGVPGSAGTVTTTGGTTNSSEGGAPGSSDSPCDDPGLVWKSANKTNYESYPDPGSEECIEFNGCTWAGQFAGCDDKKPEAWVKAHDIVAAFPDFTALELHDLCLRKGSKTIVVTVLDTCGDSDCDGCCTENQGDADQLIDVEKYTNQRWGVADGRIEWADLGPTRGSGCD